MYDPNRLIWQAVADGVVDSTDVTSSGRLNIASSSPFGRQTRPFIFETPPRRANMGENLSPPAPPDAPKRPARKALGNLTNSDEIEKHILRLELKNEEDEHAISRGIIRRFLAVANDIENAQ